MRTDSCPLTICIPAYNRPDLISWCIRSALQQTFTSFRLVIIDDSDNARTANVAAQWLAQDNRISYIRNDKRLGMVKNWNKCVATTDTTFLLILHDDDLLQKEYVANAVKRLQDCQDLGLVHANCLDYYTQNQKYALRKTQEKERLHKGKEAVEKILLNNNIACSTVMVRRECYSKLGYFNEELTISPDWEMWARIGRCYDIGHLNQVGAIVVHHGTNDHISINTINRVRQQTAYSKLISSYLEIDGKERAVIENRCKEQLASTFHVLSLLYLRRKNFKMAFAYQKYGKRPLHFLWHMLKYLPIWLFSGLLKIPVDINQRIFNLASQTNDISNY
jgi:glycosyltransferase involved in cell wall biosynthesis